MIQLNLKENTNINLPNLEKNYDDFSEDIIELKETYKKLTDRRNPLHRRLIKAFPNIKSNKYFEALNELKRNAAKK